MKKGLTIFLIILGIIVLIGIFAYFGGTKKMDEVRDYPISNINMQTIDNGIYTGSCDIGRWALDVKVHVNKHRIADVTIIDRHEFYSTDDLMEELNEKIIGKTDPDFDAITGATITSRAYMIAVTNALNSEKNNP